MLKTTRKSIYTQKACCEIAEGGPLCIHHITWFYQVQRCQMATLACEAPEVTGRPISQWTGREIADEMVKRGIVPHISATYAADLIKKKGLKPHLWRYWLNRLLAQ